MFLANSEFEVTVFVVFEMITKLNIIFSEIKSRRPSGLRKTTITLNSLAHRTTWLHRLVVFCEFVVESF